nr:hypothetical protein CFP56_61452 [Quercus suber]
MTGKCPVAPNPIQRLITHKDYAVEMVNSIINETDLDPCVAQSSEDLGASGLFDLSRPALKSPSTIVASFAMDSSTTDGSSAVDLGAPDTPPS